MLSSLETWMASIEKVYNDRDKMESRRLISEYVRNFLEAESIPGIEWEFNAQKTLLPSITLTEVNGLIQNFIHDDNRVVVVTGPEKEGLKQVTESEILAVLNEVKEAEIKPYEDGLIAQALMSDLPKAGSIDKAFGGVLPATQGQRVGIQAKDYGRCTQHHSRSRQGIARRR